MVPLVPLFFFVPLVLMMSQVPLFPIVLPILMNSMFLEKEGVLEKGSRKIKRRNSKWGKEVKKLVELVGEQKEESREGCGEFKNKF